MLKEPKNVQMQVLVQEGLGSLPASTHPYRGTAILNATGPLGGLSVEVTDCFCISDEILICSIFH